MSEGTSQMTTKHDYMAALIPILKGKEAISRHWNEGKVCVGLTATEYAAIENALQIAHALTLCFSLGD